MKYQIYFDGVWYNFTCPLGYRPINYGEITTELEMFLRGSSQEQIVKDNVRNNTFDDGRMYATVGHLKQYRIRIESIK